MIMKKHKKKFSELPKLNQISIILVIIFGVIAIASMLVCALCPNIIVKIISGVLIGLSTLVFFVIWWLSYYF